VREVCGNVLQCVAACCSSMVRVFAGEEVGARSVLQCVAMYCNVLQCVAACCSSMVRVFAGGEVGAGYGVVGKKKEIHKVTRMST